MNTAGLFKQTLLMTLALAALAAAGWLLALRGLHSQLHTARAELTRQELRLSAHTPAPQDAQDRAADLERRSDLLERIVQETPVADTLYETIRRTAAAAGVRIDRLDPSGGGRRTQDLSKTLGVGIEPVGVELQARGDLAAIVAFTGALERDSGLCRLTSFRLQPAPGGAGVLLQLSCTHFPVVRRGDKEHP